MSTLDGSSSSASSSGKGKLKNAMGKLKASGTIASKGAERVRVVVRCRPLMKKEKDAGHKGVVRMDKTMGQVTIINPAKLQDPPKTFTFDSVYDWNSTQRGIYDDSAAHIVDCVLEGYNGTIFAYGQTGTGKTHTMEGEQDPEELKGIIPNAFEHIFSNISGEESNVEFLVQASYLEIYNEEVRDLLAKSEASQHLELKESKDMGVYVKDLSKKVVKDVKQIDHVMQFGKKNRTTGKTEMNARSSRSHSIFIITVETCNTDDEGEQHIRAGKLNLVDLAGSERQAKTKASGERLKEGCAINLSLSALGNVISALIDDKTNYIPYRDSKLTRLLQDSLGGNSKTVMIANIGPADYNYDETISTLRYANRAKSIKNKPKINEDPKDAMLRQLQEEIQRLRSQVDGTGIPVQGPNGEMIMGTKIITKIDTETMDRMKKELDQEKAALLEEKDMAESEKEKIRQELLEREKQLEEEKNRQKDMEKKLASLEAKLIVGGENLVEKTKRQELELRRHEQELLEKQKLEARLKAQMEEQQAETLNLKEQYGSIQEEVEAKTRRLQKLFQKYKGAKSEIADLEQEFQVEKADMLETIRELTRDLKLRMLIIDNFIPFEEQKKIEERAEWDEDHGEWRIPHVDRAGNNLEMDEAPRRPISAAGLRRPMSEFSRICSMLPQHPPRYKYENVMDLELEYPERTTMDYEAVSLEDQRVQAALDSAFQEEEEVTFSAMDNLPSMFLSYSGDKGGNSGNSGGGRPKTAGKNRGRSAQQRGQNVW